MNKRNAGKVMTDRVRSCMKEAVTGYSKDLRDTVRDLISVPVTYVGGEAIRSEPGESPYKEFGDLWKSIKYRVKELKNSFESSVFSDSIISLFLEEGTQYIEPRPHWAVAMKMVGDPQKEVKRRFTKCMNQKNKKRR